MRTPFTEALAHLRLLTDEKSDRLAHDMDHRNKDHSTWWRRVKRGRGFLKRMAAVVSAPKYNPALIKNTAALTRPDFHALNEFAGRHDRLLHAVLCAYAKHQLDCENIGWDQLGDILWNVICNELGDSEAMAWTDRIKRVLAERSEE